MLLTVVPETKKNVRDFPLFIRNRYVAAGRSGKSLGFHPFALCLRQVFQGGWQIRPCQEVDRHGLAARAFKQQIGHENILVLANLLAVEAESLAAAL